METLGHTVAQITTSEVSVADATGKDLVYISPTVNSPKILDKFAGIGIPVITSEAYLYDDMGFTGTVADTDFGNSNGTIIRMDNTTHALGGGLSGNVTVDSAAGTIAWAASLPPSAIKIASLSGSPCETITPMGVPSVLTRLAFQLQMRQGLSASVHPIPQSIG